MEKETIGQKLYRYKIHHILLWLCYYVFWMFVYRGYYPSLWPLFLVTSVYFLFNAITFYIIAYYLLPVFLYQRKYTSFAVGFLLLVLAATSCLAICLYFMLRNVAEVVNNPVMIFLTAFLSIVTIVSGLSAIKLIMDKMKSDRKTQRLETQRIEAELQYLKAQVNPHFLFNTINSVYFLIKKDPEIAAATLIKLSDLLRFQLYDCSDEKISIEKEIEYLQNYVALEKIRKGDKVKIDFETRGVLAGFQIAPFLLIPFLENAFKYVSGFSGKENKIEVSIEREGNLLKVRFFNTKDYTNKVPGGGIGHKNVMRRLELLYSRKHALSIKERQDSYDVLLELQLS